MWVANTVNVFDLRWAYEREILVWISVIVIHSFSREMVQTICTLVFCVGDYSSNHINDAVICQFAIAFYVWKLTFIVVRVVFKHQDYYKLCSKGS